MPILSGLLSSMFGAIVTLLAARMSIGMAAAGAFVAVMTTAYLAVKAAIAAASAGLAAIVPPAGVALAGYFMPGNLAGCLTAIILADAIITSWDYWRHTVGAAIHLAKG